MTQRYLSYTLLHCLFFLTFVGLGTTRAQDFTPFFDFYNLGGWKAYASSQVNDYSVWDRIEHDCSRKVNPETMEAFKFMPKTSQADFRSLAKSRAPVSVISFGSMPKFFLRSKIFKASELKYIMACITGMQFSESVAYIEDFNYFDDFMGYYNFLKSQRNVVYPFMGLDNTFMMISNKSDFQLALDNPDQLGIILSLTGAHVLGSSVFQENGLTTTEGYRRLILKNIQKLKGQVPIMENTSFFMEHPIFYFGLASADENGIVGSARMMGKKQESVFGKQTNVGTGFTALGQEVVEALLDDTQGNRILIDISQMSLDGRKQYYAYVRDLRKEGKEIPIVASHVGISGLNWDSDLYRAPDDELKNLESYLNHWRISMSRQDIQNILESKGLIGVPIQLQKTCGTKFFLGLREIVPGSAQERAWYVQAYLANVFTIVDVHNKKEAWDHIVVGSEFDRISPSYRPYETAAEMQAFIRDITKYLESEAGIFDLFAEEDIDRLSFGYEPKELVHKLFYENSARFIMEHLPD
ncbi:MAG: hypothetical protein AAFV80_14610 [Bacteroidota bacterium]